MRAAMLMAAGWFAALSLPLLVTAHSLAGVPGDDDGIPGGVVGATGGCGPT